MSTPLEIRINATVVLIEGAYAESHFPDGSMVRAYPENTPEYRRTAKDLGYGSDVGSLCVGHELAHSVLAEARGLPYSPVLWAVAHGEPATDAHFIEETEAMALQRYTNGGPRPSGPLDWDAMRDRLIEVTR